MRPSVMKRAERASATHRRMLLYMGILLIAALCALFLAYTTWRVNADIRAHEQATSQLDADIATKREARLALAKKSETTAIANAASYASSIATSDTSSAEATSATCTVTMPDSIRVIVNKKHCITPIDWSPGDLVQVHGYYLRSEAASHLSRMMDDASTTGVPLALSSAYRSYTDQASTYAEWVTINGSIADADSVSARPGYSEHQTGLAVDFKQSDACVLDCFGKTAQYTWLVAHAAEYGFIQRYPSGLMSITGYDTEAWHWRYVGTQIANDMKSHGIQTLEAYFGISGGMYN